MRMFKVQFNGDNPSVFSGRFWIKVLIMALAIFISSYLFSFAKIDGPISALVAALIISLLNAFIRPILVLFSLPLMVFSFGLFYLVINALIILLTSKIVGGFSVDGFWNAIWFSIVITVIGYLLELPEKIRKIKKAVNETFINEDISSFNQAENTKKENYFVDYEDVTEEENKEEENKEQENKQEEK